MPAIRRALLANELVDVAEGLVGGEMSLVQVPTDRERGLHFLEQLASNRKGGGRLIGMGTRSIAAPLQRGVQCVVESRGREEWNSGTMYALLQDLVVREPVAADDASDTDFRAAILDGEDGQSPLVRAMCCRGYCVTRGGDTEGLSSAIEVCTGTEGLVR